MVIQEAMEYLQRNTVPHVTDLEALADDQFIVGKAGGAWELVTAPPLPEKNVAYSIDGLAEQALHYAGRGKVVIFVGESMVTAVMDEDKGRRGCVAMNLVLSEQMEILKKGLAEMKQRGFILALRHHFHDSMVDEGLLPLLRQLKFVSQEGGESDIKTGRESMGMSVQKRISGIGADGEGDLPDDIGLNVPVYRTLRRATVDGEGDFFRVPVVCTFDVNVDKGEFNLKPKPGELERAVVQANEAVAKEIREAITAKGLGKSEDELPKVIAGAAYRT